jgi:general secretion pathway protein K
MRNERGVALLVVLTVVTLLTITITEFTYAVLVDQHRVRNSLNALQAALLARSGVNIAESFLAQDTEVAFDAYTEDWWLALEEFRVGLELGESARLAIRVEDEGGKINVNLTRPPRRETRERSDQPTRDAFLRDALRRIFEAHGIEVEIVDRVEEYWLREEGQDKRGRPIVVQDFGSLEDFAAAFGIPRRKLVVLRPLLTAHDRSVQRWMNINTAPPEVLAAVLNDASLVGEILSRQQEDEPFQNTGEIGRMFRDADLESSNIVASLFNTRSNVFRLHSSALVNIDPESESLSGIGQTLSVLVLRRADPRLRTPGDEEGVGWTFKPLDWQKEGGARLFRSLVDDDLDESGEEGERSESPFFG